MAVECSVAHDFDWYQMLHKEWELAWALRDQDGFGDGQNFMQFGLSDDDPFKFYRGMKLQAPVSKQPEQSSSITLCIISWRGFIQQL